MDRKKKKIVILFALVCSQLVIPASSFENEPQTVESVSSFFSPDLLPGQNYTWIVQEWYGIDDWLNPNTPYEPKSGDTWTMTIVGDLAEISPTITALELFGVHYEPQSLPQLSKYLQFNISGYNFEEVFGSPVGEDLNWLMLSKFFLIPHTIKDVDGNIRNFSTFYGVYMEVYYPEADLDTDNGVLSINATISEGSYTVGLGIDFEGQLSVASSFTYKRKSIETQLISGEIKLIIEQSEFDTNQSDDTSDDFKPIDAPFKIPGYPSFMGWIIVAVIILLKMKRKKCLDGARKRSAAF
jgi:hypothetical protein